MMGRYNMSRLLLQIVGVLLLYVCGTSFVKIDVTAIRERDHFKLLSSMGRILNKQSQFPSTMMERIMTLQRGGTNTQQDDTTVTTISLFNDTIINTTTITDTSTIQFQKQCDERSVYIKNILCRRHQHVLNGKRMKDIVTWMKDHQSDDPTESIISIHGLPQKSNHIETQKNTQTISTLASSTSTTKLPKKINKNDPFPIDRRNLNFDNNLLFSLPSTQPQNDNGTPVSCFVDISGEISLETQPPTILQLGVRMVQLMINFAPIWSTMGIAICSSTFRQRYWYKWITQSIEIGRAHV